MLSLIVVLPTPWATEGDYAFVLSGNALPGLGDAGPGTDAAEALPEHGSAPLEQLPRAAELVAVVPASMLSWHRAVLPKASSARMRNALEGLLEERLLDEPQTMHFSLEPHAVAGAIVWIAACNKAWLNAALHAFESAGRRVTRVVPEHVPVAAGSEPVLHVTGSFESAWLVRCADDGVQSLPISEGAHQHWNMILATEAQAAKHPVFAEPAVVALAEHALGRKVQVRHAAHAMVAAARSPWDLAQFDLASTGRTRLAKRSSQVWAQWTSPAWRPVRWGLTGLLVVNLVGLNAWAWSERSVIASRRQEVRSLLTKTFPQVQLVVNAPLQMQREVMNLRQLTGAVSSRDLEPMLAAVAVSAATAVPRSAIDYVPGELRLRGFAPPPESKDEFVKGLNAAGYRTQIDGEGWVIRAEPESATGMKASP